MKRTKVQKNLFNQMSTCSVCAKAPTSSYNRPNSLHKTKRLVLPNLQVVDGQLICTRCLKTKYKKSNN